MDKGERRFAQKYMNIEDTPEEEISWEFIRLAVASAADLAVIPLQDYLGIGKEGRINTPSTLGGNWRWRALPGSFSPELADRLHREMEIYQRLPG